MKEADFRLISCLGYIDGFTSGVGSEHSFAEDALQRNVPAPFCFPDSVEMGQAIRIVLKYIRENPTDAHRSTSVLIMRALGKAYPCTSK